MHLGKTACKIIYKTFAKELNKGVRTNVCICMLHLPAKEKQKDEQIGRARLGSAELTNAKPRGSKTD